MDYKVKEVSSDIGKKIAALRQQRSISLKELGNEVGVSGFQLLKYETGDNNISIGRLILIGKALDVPISYFFKGIKGCSFEDNNTEQEKLCIEITNSFMKLKSQQHKEAVKSLVKNLAS